MTYSTKYRSSSYAPGFSTKKKHKVIKEKPNTSIIPPVNKGNLEE
jgi:hypothetical protein